MIVEIVDGIIHDGVTSENRCALRFSSTVKGLAHACLDKRLVDGIVAIFTGLHAYVINGIIQVSECV